MYHWNIGCNCSPVIVTRNKVYAKYNIFLSNYDLCLVGIDQAVDDTTVLGESVCVCVYV